MQVDLKDIQGKSIGQIDLSDSIFATPMNEHVLYLVTKAYRANRRQGTHATKTKAMVSGTGKKPFKQKGTGGARQGSLIAPHMPGGGVAHGPQPRSYRQDVNGKTKQLALRVALSDKLRHKRLHVIKDLEVTQPSTKHITKILKNFQIKSAAITDQRSDDLLWKSARNIYKTNGFDASDLNCEHVLAHEHLLISQAALELLGKRLGGDV